MKKWSVRLLSALCVAALLVGLLPLAAVAAEEHTLWIVGDSTVCAFTDAYYYPRYGYGTQVSNYLDGTYKVENLALSGRSSKSFLAEDNYTTLKEGIKAGDALIIGFGHNDEKNEADRYTNPNGDWQTAGSFAESLWTNYVKLAQDKGAEAILCTPIVRRNKDSDTLSDSTCHITTDATDDKGNTYPGGDYPAAIRKLGTDKGVTVVDLTALTKALYEKLGAAETENFHAQTLAPKDGKARGTDNTHLNIYGAKQVAWLFANALKDVSASELGKHVVLTAGEPTKADLVSNPDYKEPTYQAPADDAVSSFPDYTAGSLVFKGTAFGELSGDNFVKDNYVLETDSDGNMHIAIKNEKCKIASTADGMAMYYYKVPTGSLIEFSATATVNGFKNDKNSGQSGFGLMARDDMYIDTVNRSLATDYVAAGSFANGGNCFYRKDAVLHKGSALTAETIEVGKSYDLKITSNSDGYACTFGKETTQTGGYDFQLTSVDPDYFYVGMFCSRSMDVTFSNISLKITGEPEKPPVKPDDPTPDVPGTTETTDAVAGGGLETLFAEIPDVADADVTAVKWSGDATGELTGDDLAYLVREATLSGGKTGVRIDIPGIKAGEYELNVTVSEKVYTAKDLTVQAHDRSGFAHQTVADDSTCTPYTEGVGAYKDDGTLKDNALVIYVTDENKDTLTSEYTRNGEKKTVTGIGKILNSNSYTDFLEFLSKEDRRPLVIRFIGTVNAPEGVSEYKKGSSNGGMVYMLSGSNITLEGIGDDATIQGWGFSFGANKDDTNYNKKARNFEARNLSFKEVPEDCLEITGFGNEDGSIKESVEHAWVHNCAFYRPSDIANPAESDKAQGDGALDFKWGRYMTSSYNYFEGCHKTSLIGGADNNEQHHVTWHHNWWKDCEQRMPLGRTADMHIYNNLYEIDKANTSSGTWYAMSLRGNSYAYSEYNTFLKVKNPVKLEATSGSTVPVGACKSYQDDFSNCTGTNGATVVTDKATQVSSTNKYANFDTAAGSYVAQSKYLLDTADRGQANIAAWGGVMKAAADMTTVAMTVPGSEKPPVVDPEDPEEPETVDTTALTAAITAAEKTIDVYTVSDDTTAADVDSGKKFVAQSDKDAYQAAIDAAKAVADKADATQEEVDKAVADLAAATTAFNKAIKKGTKGGSVNTSSSRPSGASNDSTDTPDIDVNKPASENFGDVVKDSWYEAGVTYVVRKGLFIGISKGVFAPERNMTRAMLMTVLARLDGKETEGGETWYAKGMAWAVEAGISDGTKPEGNITREQVVSMLFRYANPTMLDKSDALGDFADGANVSDWAVQAMQWAVKAGILTGKDGQRLDPQGTATRAEVAAILQRFVENTGK